MTFDALVNTVKEFCGLTSREAEIRIGHAINRHYKRLTSTLGLDAARFVTRSATTTAGVGTVTFSEIEKIDRVIDVTDSTAIRLLAETGIHDLRATQPGTGDPTRWALQNTDADAVTIRLDTLPQSTYTLQADGWTTLAELSGTDEPAFPESFHDILVFETIAEEQLKKEKLQSAQIYGQRAAALLSDLRFHLADSPERDTPQGGRSWTNSATGSAGGSGSVGGAAYTQTGLLTFDLGSGIAPFAVARSDAPYVANLGAEFIGNVTSDRLIGRDSSGTGESEQLTVGGGLEFTGSGGLQRSALTGDVTASAGSGATTLATDAVTTSKILDSAVTTAKINADAVTYAKLQNVSATSRVLGRKTSGAGDAEECTLSEVLDFVGSAAQGDLLYRGASGWTRLAAGTSGYYLQTSGAASNPAWADLPTTVRVLDRDVTQTDVANTVTNTAVYSYSLSANTLSTTKKLVLSCIGDYLNNDGAARDFSVTVEFGSTTIYNSGTLSITNTGTRRAVRLDVELSAFNSASAQVASGVLLIGGGNTIGGTNGSTAPLIHNFAIHNGVTEDTTSSQTLTVKFQHGTASSNISGRLHTAHLTLVS